MSRRPSFFNHLHPPTIHAREARFRYTFGLGGMALLLFLVLIVTGALELFYYVPGQEEANASVQLITYLVPYGWLVRGLHYWASQAMVVVVVVHMLRVVYTGGYKPPRALNWLFGILLLVFTLLLDFTGLVLRWDMDIAWALTVGTNLLKSIPGVGPSLYQLAVGSSAIGAGTVVRFFGWHIFGLTLPAFFLTVWHLFKVRRDGGISHLAASQGGAASTSHIPRRELVRREVLATVVSLAVLVMLAVVAPPSIGAPADFNHLPAEATAPWFFLWVQQLLQYGHPLLMGVVIPVAFLTLLALIPYAVDRSREGTAQWFNRPGRLAQILATAIVLFVLAFILRGWLA
jgi:quinol-cytochrome oxidoreductase complex cytochrome b subunit